MPASHSPPHRRLFHTDGNSAGFFVREIWLVDNNWLNFYDILHSYPYLKGQQKTYSFMRGFKKC
jgi:hypothetical protein